MANKPQTEGTTSQTSAEPFGTLAQLQEAGLGNMMGMGRAWVEAMSDLSAEMASFVAERIREDVKTQHQILHCKDIGDLQQIQAAFVQKAIEQYQAETGKLVDMSTKAFTPKTDKT